MVIFPVLLWCCPRASCCFSSEKKSQLPNQENHFLRYQDIFSFKYWPDLNLPVSADRIRSEGDVTVAYEKHDAQRQAHKPVAPCCVDLL